MTALTIIVLAHAEGPYLFPAVASAEEAIRELTARGLMAEAEIERLLVLDQPDQPTQQAAASIAQRGYQILMTNHGDPALARNTAVEAAHGRYIAFLDGDDLWSSNWLAASFELAAGCPDTVLHAEYNLIFGGSSMLFRQTDPTEPWFSVDYLRAMNCWDALTVSPRQIYVDYPFVANDVANGYAHEDFHWSAMTYCAGVAHRLVEGTIHFKRRRANSVSVLAEERGVTVRPSGLTPYDAPIYARLDG